nr:venom peptide Htgkr28 [Hadogenes troglodytes]
MKLRAIAFVLIFSIIFTVIQGKDIGKRTSIKRQSNPEQNYELQQQKKCFEFCMGSGSVTFKECQQNCKMPG